MRKNIEVIPAKPIREIRGLEPTAKTRVCAYCRVSTDNEEQIGSFDAQVSYYKKLISSKEDWEVAGIYADEGISGTNTKNRAMPKLITRKSRFSLRSIVRSSLL